LTEYHSLKIDDQSITNLSILLSKYLQKDLKYCRKHIKSSLNETDNIISFMKKVA